MPRLVRQQSGFVDYRIQVRLAKMLCLRAVLSNSLDNYVFIHVHVDINKYEYTHVNNNFNLHIDDNDGAKPVLSRWNQRRPFARERTCCLRHGWQYNKLHAFKPGTLQY